jgi:hypothetical protein
MGGIWIRFKQQLCNVSFPFSHAEMVGADVIERMAVMAANQLQRSPVGWREKELHI